MILRKLKRLDLVEGGNVSDIFVERHVLKNKKDILQHRLRDWGSVIAVKTDEQKHQERWEG